MLASLRSVFNHPGLRRFLVRLGVPLAIVAIVAAVPFLRREWLLAGFIVSMVGEFIQLWSFASLHKNSKGLYEPSHGSAPDIGNSEPPPRR